MRLKKIDATGKPYHIYAEYLDSVTLDQFISVMQHDSVVQGALMPDAHQGSASLPVGGVVAVQEMVFPSFVGTDIGCGMLAVPTSFQQCDVERDKQAIFEQICNDVLVGASSKDIALDFAYKGPVSEVAAGLLRTKGVTELGLGGGNHFIEIGFDETGRIWIVLHSGSRNLGKQLAKHYMKIAAESHKAREGSFGLRTDSADGKAYIADLALCLEFALTNRLSIARRVEKAMKRHVDGAADFGQLVNRNHNHAESKVMPIPGARGHRTVWIHRKGATHAEAGMPGVIPGCMRDGLFIVRGKGNPESLFSSSHGAGRVMGRADAKRLLDMAAYRAEMAARGIAARVDESTLDESAGAYKDIFEVMALQSDLVEVLHHVKPMINVKG